MKKKNCKEILNIKHIINSLHNVMTRGSNLDLNSEVIIVDENYKEYDNFDLYVLKDVYYGEYKVRMQLRPKKVEAEAIEIQDKIIKEDLLGIVEEPKVEPVEEVQASRNWWDKYR